MEGNTNVKFVIIATTHFETVLNELYISDGVCLLSSLLLKLMVNDLILFFLENGKRFDSIIRIY